MSHLSAWQLGRLLALSSASYSGAVRRWAHVKGLERMKAGHTRETRALGLVDALAGYLEAHRTSHPDHETDPLFRDAMAIAEWLAALLRLVPVPLRYLVPSGRMLPAEAIRTFHLDPAWTIDALAMGALSYGTESVRLAPETRPRSEVRAAIWKMFKCYSEILSNAGRDTHAVPSDASVSGFLLRSRLTHEYPGVEITLWRGTDKVAPIRFERLSDDVLLVLWRDTIDEVRLRSPREGLRFGCDQGFQLDPVGSDGQRLHAAIDLKQRGFLNEASSVLGMAGLARALVEADTTSGVGFAAEDGTIAAAPAEPYVASSAGLAWHWMRRPTDFTLAWEHAR